MASGTSYNGWPASDDKASIGVEPFGDAVGLPFPGGVKAGDVATVLGYVATQLHYRVEPCVAGCDWGHTFKANVNNPSQLSCHASGTAIDYNAPDHPNGSSNTFSDQQVGEIYAILNEVQGAVDWLEGYDEMHFEIAVDAGTLSRIAATLPAIGTDPAPDPGPPPDDEDEEIMRLVQADSGNGAVFAFSPGRFIHVPDQAHLDVGGRTSLWGSEMLIVSPGDLDILRDNCVGNGKNDTPDAKGVNLTDRLPSAIAGT
jgi:hypothetical protein